MTISTSEIGSTTNLASFPDRVKEEAELSNGGQSGEDSSSLDGKIDGAGNCFFVNLPKNS